MNDALNNQIINNKSEHLNQYKTIEQIVRIGKANTKPVSVRLSVDTLKYFEENAKKYNTKTGTIISDILDDYVRNLRHIEMRRRMEIEVMLMNLYRHVAEKDSEAFFIRWLIDRTSSEENIIKISEKEISIIRPRQDYGGEKVTSIFHLDDPEGREGLVEKIAGELKEIKRYAKEHVEDINGDPENDPAVFSLTPKELFVNIDGNLLVPYNIDFMYNPEYSFGDEEIFIVPVEDWLFITSLIAECASIKTRQLGREIYVRRFIWKVMEEYNKVKTKLSDSKKGTTRAAIREDRMVFMYYRSLIREVARYEDLPSSFGAPKNLDEESEEYE